MLQIVIECATNVCSSTSWDLRGCCLRSTDFVVNFVLSICCLMFNFNFWCMHSGMKILRSCSCHLITKYQLMKGYGKFLICLLDCPLGYSGMLSLVLAFGWIICPSDSRCCSEDVLWGAGACSSDGLKDLSVSLHRNPISDPCTFAPSLAEGGSGIPMTSAVRPSHNMAASDSKAR